MNRAETATVSKEDVERIAVNLHHDPFEILGPHRIKAGRANKWVVRAWLPDAERVFVRMPKSNKETEMQSVFNEHFFEVIMTDWKKLPIYQLHIIAHNGHERFVHDPYFFCRK